MLIRVNDDGHVRHLRRGEKPRADHKRPEKAREGQRRRGAAQGDDGEAGNLDRISRQSNGWVPRTPRRPKSRRHTHLRQTEDDINFTGNIRVVVAEDVLRGRGGGFQ